MDVPSSPQPTRTGTSLTTHFHGDHRLAIFLTTVYDSMSRFAAQPMLVAGVAALTAPLWPSLGAQPIAGVVSIHGPPGIVRLTRGPPAFS
jgi:hypothetical protein